MKSRVALVAVSACFLVACSDPPPKRSTNICEIFKEYPQWYWHTQEVQQKWGAPISVQMTIIYEESSFRNDAKPPREKLFGFIPWVRETTASGYSQALNPTWQLYLKATNQRGASRTNFANAVDFIGWFTDYAHKELKLKKSDMFDLYLAYHEGINGYRNHSYIRKPWLVHLARESEALQQRYHKQLLQCAGDIPQKPWWHVW